MKKIVAIFLFTVSLVLISCGNDKKNSEPEVIEVETTKEKEAYVSEKMEVEFNDPKVAEIYKEYIDLKTALVNTNAETAGKEASDLMTAFANIGVDEDTFMAAQSIVESEDIETQRSAFVSVTNKVESMLEGAIKSGKVYKQYCPMAFGNTGGYWLSNSKDIMNPYFGDKMLKCGRVSEEIE